MQLGLSLGLTRGGGQTLIQRAIASLRARGSDAHLWLPGGDVKTYGPELVTNGGFDADSVWVKGNNTTISGGTLNILGGSTATTQPYTITSGQSFSVTYTITSVTTPDSGMRVRLGSTASGTLRTTAGTYSEILTATASGSSFVVEVPSLFVGSIDNISVREITSITPTITSGLTTGNYLESTGNTLGTVDNPTGLVLDALGTVGGNIAPAFVAGPAWALASGVTISSNTLVYATAVAAGAAFNSQLLTLGKTYKVTFTISNYVSGSFRPTTQGGAVTSTFNSNGTFTEYFVNVNNVGLIWYTGSSGLFATISNTSITEVSGIHLTQGTTANKPVLRRGAYNLLLNSVLAGGTSGVEGSGAVAPTNWAFGSATGSVTFSDGTARFVAASQRPFIGSANITLPVGSYILSAKVVDGSYSLLAGVIGLAAVSAVVSATTYKKNNVTATGAESIAPGDVVSALFSVTTAGTATMRVGLGCAGAATGDITLSQPQLETGSTASAYSPTTTAAASNPDAGRYSWSFDGSNDSLALGSVPFQMGDDHCVIAGVTPTRATDYVLNLGSGAGIQQIAAIYLSGSVVAASWVDDASTVATTSELVPVLGVSKVVSATKMSDAKRIRINSVQQGATNNTAMGVTTVTTGYIGGFKPASYPFNGSTGPVLAIKGTVTDAELLMYERLVASLTPGAPTF